MAVKYPLANGNWSNASNWNDGTLPQPGDVVHANFKTVTIDQDIEVARITNESTTGVTAGGTFLVSGNRTLTCDVKAGNAANAFCLTLNNPETTVINGNVLGADIVGSNTQCVVISSPVNLTVNGDVWGATTNPNSSGISVNAGSSNCVVTINGHVYARNGAGVQNSAALNFTFYCKGITVLGSTTPGVSISGTNSDVVVDGPLISNLQAALVQPMGNLKTTVVRGPLVSGPSGRVPIQAGRWAFADDSPYKSIQMRTANRYPLAGDILLLTDTVDNPPAPADVRAGVTYGENDELTGTLAMPTPDKVAANVPVDDTVGTASLDISEVVVVVGAQIASVVGE